MSRGDLRVTVAQPASSRMPATAILDRLPHLGFWQLFDWHEQLPHLWRLNMAVKQARNLMRTPVLIGLGAL